MWVLAVLLSDKFYIYIYIYQVTLKNIELSINLNNIEVGFTR